MEIVGYSFILLETLDFFFEVIRKQYNLICAGMAQPQVDYVRPELLEEAVEQKHRSYRIAVLGESICTPHTKSSRLLMPIHQLWSLM
jgi:hypothetical protein